MFIYHYTNSRFTETDTIEVDLILGTPDPDEITDDMREAMRNDEVRSMCNFITKDNRMLSIPWEFIIEINSY